MTNKILLVESSISSTMEEVANFGYTRLITEIATGLLLLFQIPRGTRPLCMRNLEDKIKSSIKEPWLAQDFLLAIEPIYSILKIRML